MLLWSMVIVGICVFTFGLYYLIKNHKYGKHMKVYSVFAYCGLAIAVLGVILLMEPIFTKLPGTSSSMVPFAISMSIFMVAAHLLLKPAFRKK